MAKRRQCSPKEVRKRIASLRGSLKRKPGEKPFAEWMAESNTEEKMLEEAKRARLSALRPR